MSKIVPPETAKKAAKKLAIVKVKGGKNVVLPDSQGAHGVSRLKIKVNIPAPKNVNKLMTKIVFRAERKATNDEAITPLKVYIN